jgi:xylulokinase
VPAAGGVVVGLDAGTTSAKFVAVDEGGAIVATASSDPIATSTASPGSSVQEPAEIWHALATACRRGADLLPDAAEVKGLSIAAQSGTVIPIVGGRGTEAITWMDSRSQPLVESWDDTTRRTIRRHSGWQPSPGLGLSTIAWLRAHDGSADAVQRWASVDDHLVHRLTGTWVTNPSNAAGMQLMDAASRRWSAELCDIADIDPTTLSTIHPSGAQAGPITAAAASATGLPVSTPVIVGGHDQACAALSLDVITPGSAFLSMGTAWVLTIVTDRPEIELVPEAYNLSPHVVPRCWSISQNLGGYGAALTSVMGTGEDTVDLEDALSADPQPVDHVFFLPAIHAPDRAEWGRFTGDDLPDTADQVRAVMEACAFEVRRAVEEAASITTLHELTVVGGGTRSPHLTQRIADVTGLTLRVRPDASWPALGAARLAATANGWPTTTARDQPSAMVHPQPGADGPADRRYGEYLRLTAERIT